MYLSHPKPRYQERRTYVFENEHGESFKLKVMKWKGYDSKNALAGSLRIAQFETKLIEAYTYSKFPFSFIPGLGEMADAIFGKNDRRQMLFLLSKAAGKLKSVSTITWIYDINYIDSPEGSEVLKTQLNNLYKPKERMLFIASGIQSSFIKSELVKNGFISLEGVPYFIAGKFNREQRVKFRVWFTQETQ